MNRGRERSRHGSANRSTARHRTGHAARTADPALIAGIAVGGLLAAGCSLALGLTNDDVTGIQVLLLEWISIPYIVAGLIAWWRRPDSRLGVLMIAAGFATALSALAFAQYAAPHTVGVIFDVLPAVIFLHVYLAYPSGRLRSAVRAGAGRRGLRGGDRPAAGQDADRRRRGAEPPRDLVTPGRGAHRRADPAPVGRRDLPRRRGRARRPAAHVGPPAPPAARAG